MRVRRPSRRPRGEDGETLIEILFTVMILGIAFTALIGAITVTLVSSDAQRRLSDTEIVTRDYGEAIKNANLHPPATTVAQIPGHAPGDTVALTVADASGFPTSGMFGIQIDTEEFTVTGGAGTTTWTATAYGSIGHADGSTVTRYDACPTPAQLIPAAFSLPPDVAKKIQMPQVSAMTVEYFDAGGAPVANANCTSGSTSGYWNGGSQICSHIGASAPGSGDHLTECDPPLIRLSFSVNSCNTPCTAPESDTRRFAKTSAQVLLRRDNA